MRPADHLQGNARNPGSGLATAVRRAARRVTWQVAAATLGIALALEVWSLLEVTLHAEPDTSLPHTYLSALVINVTMAFCLMFTTFVADELSSYRAKSLGVYATSIVVGAGLGALLQWEIHRLLALSPRADFISVPSDFHIAQPAFLFLDYLVWGSIIVWIYVNRRAELRAAARMTAAQLQRAETQRRTLKARLQAMQAQVEPQFLHRTLARVGDRYETDPGAGSAMLGRLIVYLRAALPQLRESTSTLAREVDLACAYVDVMREDEPDDITVHADLPEAVRTARMPPMVLLPLINHAVAAIDRGRSGTVTIRIVAQRIDTRLRLVVACSGQRFGLDDTRQELADIGGRLRELYGVEGGLAFESSAGDGMRAIITIPYEGADRDHR
jgi:hypothetical protein